MSRRGACFIGYSFGYDVEPIDPVSEYGVDTGVSLAHYFAGDSATDKVAASGVTLAKIGTALVDTTVVDTLDPGGNQWSHAYKMQAVGDAWDAPSPTAIAIGTASVMLHVTLYAPAVGAGSMDIAGNETATSGLAVQLQTGGNIIGVARIAGVPVFVTIPGRTADTWVDVVLIADRTAGLLKMGTVEAETSAALPAGSLASSRAFSIGRGRVQALVNSQVMAARLAFGPQVESLRPREVAQAAAKRVWWDQVYSRIPAPAR